MRTLATALRQLDARRIHTRNHLFMHPLARVKKTTDHYRTLPGWEVVGWVAVQTKVALVYKCHIKYTEGEIEKGQLYWRRLANKHIYIVT